MRMKYDFDKIIDRRGTGALKTDALKEFFGRDDETPLWVADMDFEVAPEIAEALERRMAHHIYGYAVVPEGYKMSIVDWLRNRHGWEVDPSEIAYVNGVVRGIAFILQYFTSKGDKILIQPPVYHPFRRLIEGNGRVCVTSPLRAVEGGYEMDLEDLERKFAEERPAMMILCNPHNPVGIQWSRETLAAVASLAYKYGVKVISDEIHGDLMLWGTPHVPYLSVSPEAEATGILLGAPSKTFNIPGLASSWIVVKDKELREEFYEWMETNEFSAPTFVATLATEAAYRNGEPWLDAATYYIEENIRAVERYCAECLPEIRPVRPGASFLIWLDCRPTGLSHEEIVELFLDKAHLALNDGSIFGEEGRGYMRLNVGSPRCVILDALGRLRKALESYRN